ncbi:phosphomannomutase [Sedimentimonas flavescens]|uniref:Phosphomannomutase n=1 Tax=Sedimentimonas flavescens TaxID=2851012 RepID=A0ABT2ZZT5_9RHOB|nr:phosphomannomutase [Sedimentimonas flavescens]MCV2878994.1 phosphomannomutase [Sedimentimonas flavescens]
MPPKFGTSGLRGLVTELTPDLVADYTRAFVASCAHGGAVHVGWDLRPSSPAIAEEVMRTIVQSGLTAIDCGALPTPALALAAMGGGHAAIMVTGSHIPADRNGLKFYTPAGEITKDDEARILSALGAAPGPGGGTRISGGQAGAAYQRRYTEAFGHAALSGLRVGVYEHSSVARDLLGVALRAMGAEVIALARSDIFIPVDTEAVDPDTRARLAEWCAQNRLDALVSTDGDADRPMLCDASGKVVPGDVLGALTARALGADVICTPVSSNTMIDAMPAFARIARTRIGSPYVIAAMEEILAANPAARICGYEANGGFLLGFAAHSPAGVIAPLMTRDCLLPIVTVLAAARGAQRPVADLVAALPARFTASDRIAGIEPEVSARFIADLRDNAPTRAGFFTENGAEASLDLTDGLRVRFEDGAIVHLRPSGNAPEFRCYTEAGSEAEAARLLQNYLAKLRTRLG